MKANELMIGDRVYDTILKCNTQVEMLSLSGIRGDCHDNIWNENTFEPIPLTTEILEKNGFRIIFKGELHTTYFQDIKDFHVEIKIDCINYIKLSMLNGLGYKITIECKFVHQLQQALRLCGIEKEIEL